MQRLDASSNLLRSQLMQARPQSAVCSAKAEINVGSQTVNWKKNVSSLWLGLVLLHVQTGNTILHKRYACRSLPPQKTKALGAGSKTCIH